MPHIFNRHNYWFIFCLIGRAQIYLLILITCSVQIQTCWLIVPRFIGHDLLVYATNIPFFTLYLGPHFHQFAWIPTCENPVVSKRIASCKTQVLVEPKKCGNLGKKHFLVNLVWKNYWQMLVKTLKTLTLSW